MTDPEVELAGRFTSPVAEDEGRYTPGRIGLRAFVSRSERPRRRNRLAKVGSSTSGADPGPEDLRPGDGQRCVPGGEPAVNSATSWSRPGTPTMLVPADIPADEDEVLYARRLIAQRCLVRRRQEPDMAVDSGQVVAVAGNAGQGPPVHVSRPLACVTATRWSASRAARSLASTGSRRNRSNSERT